MHKNIEPRLTFVDKNKHLSGVEYLQHPDSIVIFGGTFDPFHDGHLSVVKTLAYFFKKIVLAPTPQNPWKKDLATNLMQRVEMIKITLAANSLSAVFSKQVEPEKITILNYNYHFSKEVIEYLKISGHEHLYWAVGLDSVPDLTKWKNWLELKIQTFVLPINIDIHSKSIREGKTEVPIILKEYLQKNRLYLKN